MEEKRQWMEEEKRRLKKSGEMAGRRDRSPFYFLAFPSVFCREINSDEVFLWGLPTRILNAAPKCFLSIQPFKKSAFLSDSLNPNITLVENPILRILFNKLNKMIFNMS